VKKEKSLLYSHHNEPRLRAKMPSSKTQNTPFLLRLFTSDTFGSAAPQSIVPEVPASVVRGSVVSLSATNEFQTA
jgi:hypothetical protein